jgi:hypothetical protein
MEVACKAVVLPEVGGLLFAAREATVENLIGKAA